MKTTMTKQFLFLAILGCVAAPVTAQTVDVTLQCGQSYTINSTVAATAATGLTYRWLENGSTVTEITANYTVPATKSVGIYTYIRQARSEGCTDWQNSNAFTVEVKNKDGIDGVCLGGLMWAKYNVDEPGTFATTPDSLGKHYQFNRNIAYPIYGDCTWPLIGINEDSDWNIANDPCPDGWRIPTATDALNMYNNVIYEFHVAATNYVTLSSPYKTLLPLPTELYSIRIKLGPYRSGDHGAIVYSPNIHTWTSTSVSAEYAASLWLGDAATMLLDTPRKDAGMPIRCVR